MTVPSSPDDRPRVGISECLLGVEVRHDGGHKRDRFVTGVLDEYFDWVSVCPEMEVGMGTPREPVRLQRTEDGPKMITIKTGVDWTERMETYSRQRCDQLALEGLRGFILKKASPSCGMERVKLYDHNGVPSWDGVGLFARRLMERFPDLPVEEEGRLNDRGLRENFIGRVYTYHRWRSIRDAGAGAGDVVAFHTRHKLLLLAHDPESYYAMGRLVGRAGEMEPETLLDEYQSSLMAALARPAPVRRHVNALEHVMGFLKDELSGDDKAEILDVIGQYRKGLVPLITPLTLLKYHLRSVDHPWIHDQVYLDPYPRELALRSHL